MAEQARFKMSFKSPLATKLKASISRKLLDFIPDYIENDDLAIFSVDGVEVAVPGLFYGRDVAVHGLAGFSDEEHLASAVAKNRQVLHGKKLNIAKSDPKQKRNTGQSIPPRHVLKKGNWWYYEVNKLGEKRFMLPPGDLGLPFIGNMWSFLSAFKSPNPDSFISSIVTRYGKTGIYKVFMFGQPSVIVTTPDLCKRVLTDDEKFIPGWPTSTVELIGPKSFIGISFEEHKRLRRLTAAPVNGHEALSLYIKYIEDIVVSSLDKWSSMGQIEFLTQLRKVTFRIIMYIFLSSESESVLESLEKEYTALNYGVRAMAINIPGFAYHGALKARKNLVRILEGIVNERRKMQKKYSEEERKDMMDSLINVEDENGRRLTNEEIIDVLIMYLNAGHESSGHITMWATLCLESHPECFQKAKAEQEEIIKNRPPTQKGLSLNEVRKMDYLSQVIDETLRLITFSLMVFRKTTTDVNLSGYTVPKGWRVLVWFRSVHFDPEIYPEPMKFDPSRWDNFTPKAGSFLPFGAGSRLCPGNDLAKLEISIFLHHYLLKYRVDRNDPKCPMMHLPHPRPKDNCLARVRKVD